MTEETETTRPADVAGRLDGLVSTDIAFRDELQHILNKYCAENGSNTPDYILCGYLLDCLTAYDKAVQSRARWYGRMDEPGQSANE